MSVVKKNLYKIGDNTTITNLVSNTPKLGVDNIQIAYSAPNILIKVGSTWETNGNLYRVETADVSLAAANGVLAFNSNTATFSISASAYTYNSAKGGDYIDANTRAMRFNITSAGIFSFRKNSLYTYANKRKILYYSWSDVTAYNAIDFSELNNYLIDYEELRVSGFIYSRLQSQGQFPVRFYNTYYYAAKIKIDYLGLPYEYKGIYSWAKSFEETGGTTSYSEGIFQLIQPFLHIGNILSYYGAVAVEIPGIP